MTPDWSDRLRLARTDGIGPVLYRRLLARFGTAAAAIEALPGLSRTRSWRIPSRADAEREQARADAIGAATLLLGTPGYPPLLALIEDPPIVLTILGRPELLSQPAIAIVGARNASANGRRHAEYLGAELARLGHAVVSGMARGIDAAAHAGALREGATIAAVAGGVDVVYPPENTALHAKIAERGAIVAEAPIGAAPQARHFPRRNRVIAGLSLGVVVIEAALRSGSLITARLALEHHRELYAAPGSPMDERCRGSNDLIRQGAHLVETVADVLLHLPADPRHEGLARLPTFARPEPAPPPPIAPVDSTTAHDQLLELLGPSPTPVDDLARRCHLSLSAVLAALLELELSGLVEVHPGQLVSKTPPHIAPPHIARSA